MWGQFPERTATEMLLEEELGEEDIKETQKKVRLPHGVQNALQEAERLHKNGESRKSARLIYGAFTEIIENQKKERKFIEKPELIKRLTPTMAFSLSLKALRNDDAETVWWLVQGTKAENPLHPEITKFQDEEETLGHMAARTGKLATLHTLIKEKSWLTIKDGEGNVPVNSAARHWKRDCVLILATSSPETLTIRNNQGQEALKTEAAKKWRLDSRNWGKSPISNKKTREGFCKQSSERQGVANPEI